MYETILSVPIWLSCGTNGLIKAKSSQSTARRFLMQAVYHLRSQFSAARDVSSAKRWNCSRHGCLYSLPSKVSKARILVFELFVYDLDLLGHYFAAESVDRDVDPVTLFALNNETLEARFSRRISSALRYQIKDREEYAGDLPLPAMTSCERMPHLEISRSFETDRIASHKIALSFLVPPSPFLTFTCSGISRWIEVSGKTTIKSAGPALKKSTESTSTGLRPVCSRPRVGRRSATRTSAS